MNEKRRLQLCLEKGENIRKEKKMEDGKRAMKKSRDQNGRIQYGYVYAHTYDSVKKEKSWQFYVKTGHRQISEEKSSFGTLIRNGWHLFDTL